MRWGVSSALHFSRKDHDDFVYVTNFFALALDFDSLLVVGCCLLCVDVVIVDTINCPATATTTLCSALLLIDTIPPLTVTSGLEERACENTKL